MISIRSFPYCVGFRTDRTSCKDHNFVLSLSKNHACKSIWLFQIRGCHRNTENEYISMLVVVVVVVVVVVMMVVVIEEYEGFKK